MIQKQSYCEKKKPTYEWRWERDRADWGLDYVGEGLTGVRGHNPPRFSLTSKPPAACAWDEWGLKPPAEPKSGFCRKFRILTSPPEENQKGKKKNRRSGAQRWTSTQRTHRLRCSPNQPPQREKAGGKDALTISCMVELFVGSNRKTRLRSVEKAEREEGTSGGRRANLRQGFHQK